MRIYLDHNAGAPLRAEARAAMLEMFGPAANPSSAHREGARARALLEAARHDVARLVGARPAEIVFTSGATEANNLALRGVGEGGLVVGATEHASVLETARTLAAEVSTRRLTIVPVDAAARIAPDAVAAAVDASTALVSVGLANGEVGTIAPLAAIAAAVSARGAAGRHRQSVLVHTDAAQAAGRVPLDVRALGVDLLSLSSHKLGGPAGVGALWVKGGVVLRALATGGPQERGRRAGTENVAGIVGFGAAARAAMSELAEAAARMARLTARLWDGLRARTGGVVRHGAEEAALPNTLNVRFTGCAGESLLVLLDLAGVAASLGSACAAGAPEPSHVLCAMGVAEDEARNGLRLSLGPATTDDEIERVVELLPRLVAEVRARRGAAA
jgi:cysteine desulfurase